MSELFSDERKKSFQTAWNAGAGIAGALEKIGFKSTIGYGFKGDEQPLEAIVVAYSEGVKACACDDKELNWNLRADKPTWGNRIAQPPRIIGLGMAFISKKLQSLTGEHGALVNSLRMTGPYSTGFAAMGKA